ncbi:RimK/LysX family protein [Hellea sp.]|nr:RimK/LysX family protein [Hellea sp.]
MTTPKIIGWREHIGLPDLGIKSLNVKIDTGARTSALHAHVVDVREMDGVKMVEFDLLNIMSKPASRHLCPVFDKRAVKNTGGIPEDRYIIKTRMILGKRLWPVQVSLTDRTEMTFAMILGRKAVRQRNLVIDPGQSYLAGEPQPRRTL